MKVIACFALALALLGAGCSAPSTLSEIQVTPSSPDAAVGATVQFTATGIYTHGSHPTTTQDLTKQVTWASSEITVAAVDSAGLATVVGLGTTNITATASSSRGPVTGTASLTVP
ncbi:MAG TPA: Ig-like domain-containing protein [Terriglobales bacterium]|nr:Ig-like domain-containing protein [Terriglobales bacterium]